MAAQRAKHRARTPPGRSKRTFIECTCACSSKGPNGCKDIRVCPPSPRQTGRSCSFKSRLGASTTSLTTINGTSQSMSTSRNDRPPTRKGNHPVMGVHTEPANDTNRRNLQKCYLGISWFSGCDQGSPIESICGPRGEFLKTACNDQCLRTKSRANDFPAVPGALATAGSSQPEALQGRQGCCTELPSALPA